MTVEVGQYRRWNPGVLGKKLERQKRKPHEFCVVSILGPERDPTCAWRWRGGRVVHTISVDCVARHSVVVSAAPPTDYKALSEELTVKLAQSVANTNEAIALGKTAAEHAKSAVEQSERTSARAVALVERAVAQAEEWRRIASEAFALLHRISSKPVETIHHTRMTND